MKLLKKYLPYLIICVAALFWLLVFRNIFFTSSNVDLAEKQYANSQYVLGDASTAPISDATLYEYAAYRYVQGVDPTKINFEHPPLGKYVLGISWRAVHNMTFFNFVFYILSLLLIWKLSQLFSKQYWLRIVSLTLISSLAILPRYTFDTMLDIQLLFYTLSFFASLFFIKNEKTSILATGITLGAYMSTKYFFPTSLLIILILMIWKWKQQKLTSVLPSLLVAGAFYLFTYSVYFFHHPNPIQFLRFEWYRFLWWTSNRAVPKFLLIDPILTGKFKGFWAEDVYEVAASWSLIWPFSLFAWIAGLVVIPKKITPATLMLLYSFLLLGMYLFGAAAAERYLIQLLPFWILGSLTVGERLLHAFHHQHSKRPH